VDGSISEIETGTAAEPGDTCVDTLLPARGNLGARPVDWLLDNAAEDTHWCLIHGGHRQHCPGPVCAVA